MQSRIFVEPIKARAIHIDTVKLSHTYYAADLPPPDELYDRKFEVKFKDRNGNKICTAQMKPYKSESPEPQIFIVISEYGYSGINTEYSLAKMVDRNGMGGQTDEDIESALDAGQDFIREKVGVEFDTRTARVSRFDVNADFDVGEGRIGLYRDSISRPYAQLTLSTFGSTTAYFYNKSRTFAVYGKGEEMIKLFKKGRATEDDVQMATGILRIEDRLKTAESIKRFAKKLGIPVLAGDLLKIDVARKFIASTLVKLKLDKSRFSMDAKGDLLLQHFGKDAAEMLGILNYRALLGEDFWKKLGWSQPTYYRKRGKLIAANLWDFSPDEALPALVVSSHDNNPTSLS